MPVTARVHAQAEPRLRLAETLAPEARAAVDRISEMHGDGGPGFQASILQFQFNAPVPRVPIHSRTAPAILQYPTTASPGLDCEIIFPLPGRASAAYQSQQNAAVPAR